MNIHGKDIKIFAANSTVRVSEQIAECLGLPLGKSEVSTFSDGEITVSLFESVRGSDCFIIQSTCAPVYLYSYLHEPSWIQCIYCYDGVCSCGGGEW